VHCLRPKAWMRMAARSKKQPSPGAWGYLEAGWNPLKALMDLIPVKAEETNCHAPKHPLGDARQHAKRTAAPPRRMKRESMPVSILFRTSY